MKNANTTIEIIKTDEFYHVHVNGVATELCGDYDEMAKCVGTIVKGTFKRHVDDTPEYV